MEIRVTPVPVKPKYTFLLEMSEEELRYVWALLGRSNCINDKHLGFDGNAIYKKITEALAYK